MRWNVVVIALITAKTTHTMIKWSDMIDMRIVIDEEINGGNYDNVEDSEVSSMSVHFPFLILLITSTSISFFY